MHKHCTLNQTQASRHKVYCAANIFVYALHGLRLNSILTRCDLRRTNSAYARSYMYVLGTSTSLIVRFLHIFLLLFQLAVVSICQKKHTQTTRKAQRRANDGYDGGGGGGGNGGGDNDSPMASYVFDAMQTTKRKITKGRICIVRKKNRMGR